MLEEANVVLGLGLDQTFQSWMLLSLLQFLSRKWADVFKDVDHRLLNLRKEHVTLQRAMFRERIREGSVFELRCVARSIFGGGRGHYLVEDEVEPRPLFVCLGDPGAA